MCVCGGAAETDRRSSCAGCLHAGAVLSQRIDGLSSIDGHSGGACNSRAALSMGSSAWKRQRMKIKSLWQVDEAYLHSRMMMWNQNQYEGRDLAEVAQRLLLRKNPNIICQLELWWRQVQVSFGDALSNVPSLAFTENFYVELVRKISKELLPPAEWEPWEAEASARGDWREASQGCMHLDLKQQTFMDAMFQLADV